MTAHPEDHPQAPAVPRPEVAIRVANVTKSYGGGLFTKAVVQDCSFTIEPAAPAWPLLHPERRDTRVRSAPRRPHRMHDRQHTEHQRADCQHSPRQDMARGKPHAVDDRPPCSATEQHA